MTLGVSSDVLGGTDWDRRSGPSVETIDFVGVRTERARLTSAGLLTTCDSDSRRRVATLSQVTSKVFCFKSLVDRYPDFCLVAPETGLKSPRGRHYPQTERGQCAEVTRLRCRGRPRTHGRTSANPRPVSLRDPSRRRVVSDLRTFRDSTPRLRPGPPVGCVHGRTQESIGPSVPGDKGVNCPLLRLRSLLVLDEFQCGVASPTSGTGRGGGSRRTEGRD